MLMITAAALLFAGFSLVPAHLSVLGTDVSCGAPVFNLSATRTEDPVAQDCADRNQQRILLGTVFAVIALVAGSVMLTSAKNAEGATGIRADVEPARSLIARLLLKFAVLIGLLVLAVVVLSLMLG
jgi:hypothetical protein